MNLERKQPPSKEKDPNIRERVALIMERIRQDAPAKNASDAHTLVENAFNDIEGDFAGRGEVSKPMRVSPFYQMNSMNYGGKNVLYEYYDSHVLLLGENGAIEIRRTKGEQAISNEASAPFMEFPLIVEKAGADGKTPWE